MRKLALKVHLYGGLVCFWYLILLGTSSLNFNHHFSFMQGDEETKSWTKVALVDHHLSDDLFLSQTLSDSLSLIGWPLPWETWHDSTGIFHFVVEHPGKRYVVDFSFSDHTARVQETRKGFWRVFNAMHGIGSVPNAPFMHVWKWYTRITAVLVTLSVLLGIYLWYAGKKDKRSGRYVLLISVVISLAWMLQLYLKG
jgi:hypothetical protein